MHDPPLHGRPIYCLLGARNAFLTGWRAGILVKSLDAAPSCPEAESVVNVATLTWCRTDFETHHPSPRDSSQVVCPPTIPLSERPLEESEDTLIEWPGRADRHLNSCGETQAPREEDLDAGYHGDLRTGILEAAHRLDDRQFHEGGNPA